MVCEATLITLMRPYASRLPPSSFLSIFGTLCSPSNSSRVRPSLTPSVPHSVRPSLPSAINRHARFTLPGSHSARTANGRGGGGESSERARGHTVIGREVCRLAQQNGRGIFIYQSLSINVIFHSLYCRRRMPSRPPAAAAADMRCLSGLRGGLEPRSLGGRRTDATQPISSAVN